LVSLSVPLEKGRDRQQLMKDTRISYLGRWQSEHLRTLESCYSRSPFYEFYRDDVNRLLSSKETFLLDKNLAILEWLARILAIPSSWSLTDNYLKTYPPEVVDRRDAILPKNFQEQDQPVMYTQVFADRIGFQPNLSVLDLLFCTGPAAGKILAGTY
jgi:hypothetical protein